VRELPGGVAAGLAEALLNKPSAARFF